MGTEDLQLPPSHDTDVVRPHIWSLSSPHWTLRSRGPREPPTRITGHAQAYPCPRQHVNSSRVPQRAGYVKGQTANDWGRERKPAPRALQILLCCSKQHFNPIIAGTPAGVRTTLTDYREDECDTRWRSTLTAHLLGAGSLLFEACITNLNAIATSASCYARRPRTRSLGTPRPCLPSARDIVHRSQSTGRTSYSRGERSTPRGDQLVPRAARCCGLQRWQHDSAPARADPGS